MWSLNGSDERHALPAHSSETSGAYARSGAPSAAMRVHGACHPASKTRPKATAASLSLYIMLAALAVAAVAPQPEPHERPDGVEWHHNTVLSHDEPRIFYYPNFLAHAECDASVPLPPPQLPRSTNRAVHFTC